MKKQEINPLEGIKAEERKEEFVGVLRQISREMSWGSLDALLRIEDFLGSYTEEELKEIVSRLDMEAQGTVDIAQQFIRRLWSNFGIGNIGYHEDTEGQLVEVARCLGIFINTAMFSPSNCPGEKEEPLEKYGELLQAYEAFIGANRSLEGEGFFNPDDWFSLPNGDQ